MESKRKAKHYREGFGEWVELTCDGMFKKEKIKGKELKRAYSKKIRREMKELIKDECKSSEKTT